MDEAVKKSKTKEIKGKEQIIADWFNVEVAAPKAKKIQMCCKITDNEARAIQ